MEIVYARLKSTFIDPWTSGPRFGRRTAYPGIAVDVQSLEFARISSIGPGSTSVALHFFMDNLCFVGPSVGRSFTRDPRKCRRAVAFGRIARVSRVPFCHGLVRDELPLRSACDGLSFFLRLGGCLHGITGVL